ncbi:hypothetical protein BH11ACT7_BH11ACT7_04500 [soil metagenome]
MTKRTWWLLGATLVIVIVAGGLLMFRLNHDGTNDCTTVRAMIDYNKEYGATAGSDDPEASSVDSYKEWASQLHAYADKIRNPEIARHADDLAKLADQTVTVVQEFRAEPTDPSLSEPPASAKDYARVGQQFHDELAALNQSCPD